MEPASSDCLLKETKQFGKSKDHVFKYLTIGSGEPLVLIPGTAGNERIFCRIAPLLKEQFTVYSFSHIHMKGLKNVISAWHSVLDELVGKPFHLLGTSVGGRLIQYYAQEYPEDVKSLIIGNSYADISELKRRNRIVLMTGKILPYTITRRLILRNIRKSFQEHSDYNVFVLYFQKHLNEISKHDLIVRAEWNFENLPLPVIEASIPVLLLLSKDDPVIPLKTRNHLKSYYKNARIHEFSSGGHFPYLTRPREYADAILQFLQGIV